MNQEMKNDNSKPPYRLGFFGFIPLVGFFVGVGLTLYGIIKYKDKKLIMIGIACMVFTVIIYSALFGPNFVKEGWKTHAQMNLNSLVRHIEYYKLENGVYPDSLEQLDTRDMFGADIWDPTQSTKDGKRPKYNYKNLGNTYLLFSSGTDGIPNTEDDIFPKVNPNSKNVGWRKDP
jgi:hypothetical protein